MKVTVFNNIRKSVCCEHVAVAYHCLVYGFIYSPFQ